MEQADLTTGNVRQRLLEFALPFFLANLMQATYGAMDLFTVGRFTSTSAVSSVNIGSQAMQLVTVFVTGIFLGTTVSIGGAIGMDDRKREKSAILSSRRILAAAATALTALLLLLIRPLIGWMQTPEEAVNETATYLHICVFGIPFIAIFNCYAAILRGHGDSRRPMQAVFMACVTNIAGDLILTGAMGLGVTGVAIATVSAQGMSALGAWIFARQAVHESSTAPDAENQPGLCRQILKIGIPIAMQDTLINISFMILTLVANRRGLAASSAVGVVEKLISFMFLVPSAMLSAVTTFTAQNLGAGKRDRVREAVRTGILVTALFGALMCLSSWLFPSALTSVFTRDPVVIRDADEYLKSYSVDCILVSVTFALNGCLCGSGHSFVAFLHNTLAIFLVRIPAAFILSSAFPDSMFPMGFASPLGSIFSILFLCCWFRFWKNSSKNTLSGHLPA
ncbi:MATE family efflux transporter [Clostridium vitabionis]|jgi:putative MATE family efflux protein|uniref:MATE family efflux transporter n=1 Tax=Clostridium vitabionis TaxID=2784388 RepID=UPI00188B6A3D|nr:MATE family efflux transporter [Clostridium vitabionis]